ncbi:unnamed protein product, partial [Ilex paraguariensis]
MKFNNEGISKVFSQHKSKGDKGTEIGEIYALNGSSLMRDQTEALTTSKLLNSLVLPPLLLSQLMEPCLPFYKTI